MGIKGLNIVVALFTKNDISAAGKGLFLFKPLDDLGDEQGKNKKTDRKKDFARQELNPIPAGPDLFKGSDKKSKDKCPHQDTQGCPPKIVPETDPGQPHAEIHGREGEIDQTQIENGGKSVSFDGFVIFF